MAQSSFFGKRNSDSSKTEPPAAPASTPATARPAGFFSSAPGSASPAVGAPPSFSAGEDRDGTGDAKESKLTVGPNIKLKGVEITNCDVLFIDGVVEATLDSKLIQISEQGSFNGTANIDVAEIRGTFDGDLTVRNKLTVFATGKVTGKIRYGKLVVEEGANISGEIQSIAASS